MKGIVSRIPVIGELGHLVEWLLVFNIILIGAVILLAFRLAQYKHRVEDLEDELNNQIRSSIMESTPEQPVSRRR